MQLDDAHLDPWVGEGLLHLEVGTLHQSLQDLIIGSHRIVGSVNWSVSLEDSSKDKQQDQRCQDHTDQKNHWNKVSVIERVIPLWYLEGLRKDMQNQKKYSHLEPILWVSRCHKSSHLVPKSGLASSSRWGSRRRAQPRSSRCPRRGSPSPIPHCDRPTGTRGWRPWMWALSLCIHPSSQIRLGQCLQYPLLGRRPGAGRRGWCSWSTF